MSLVCKRCGQERKEHWFRVRDGRVQQPCKFCMSEQRKANSEIRKAERKAMLERVLSGPKVRARIKARAEAGWEGTPTGRQLHDALSTQALTISEAAEVIQKHHNHVAKVLKQMRQDRGAKIVIVEWRRGNVGPMVPVYRCGDGVDAKKPKPLTNKQKCRRYRKNTQCSRTRGARELGVLLGTEPRV